jgi:hypothetical protein
VKPVPAGLESAGKNLWRSVLEADPMLCKLLAELHLPAEIPTELEPDVVRLRQRRIGMAAY